MIIVLLLVYDPWEGKNRSRISRSTLQESLFAYYRYEMSTNRHVIYLQVLVDFKNFTAQRTVDVGSRFDGFNGTDGSGLVDLLANI